MKWWAWIVPVLLSAAVYVPALDGEFVWDDTIVRDRQMVAFRSVHDVFFPPKGIPEWAKSYYRPAIVGSYLLDQALFGRDSSRGAHATVLVYNIIATFFVWMFIRQVLRRYKYREWAALVGGAIFAVHPIHTETVCWVTGRSDTVAAMFLMPSIVFALHYRDRRSIWALVLAPLLFFCALCSKEVAAAGLLVLPVLFLLVPRMEPKEAAVVPLAGGSEGGAASYGLPPAGRAMRPGVLHWLPLAGLYLAATAVYFVLRQKAGIGQGQWLQLEAADVAGRLAGAIAYYCVKVVFPPPQCALVATVWSVKYGVIAVAAISVLFGVSLLLWRRGCPVMLIALLWFGLTLLPSLTIALQGTAEHKLAERALYLPSIGLSLIVGALFARALTRPATQWIAAVVALAVVVAGAYGTVERVRVWHDPLSLWTNTAATATDTGLPRYSLGMEYLRAGEHEKALEAFRESLELHTRFADREGCFLAHNSIGAVLMGMGKLEEAEAAFRASLQVNPAYPTAYYNLGKICETRAGQILQQNRQPDFELMEQARAYYTTAIRLNQNYTKARYSLAGVERMMAVLYSRLVGDQARAQQLWESARAGAVALAQLDPNSPQGQSAVKLIQIIDAERKQAPRP